MILTVSNKDLGGFGAKDFDDLFNDSSFDKEKGMDPVVRLHNCDEHASKRKNARTNVTTTLTQSRPDEEQAHQDSPTKHKNCRPTRFRRGRTITY